MLNFLWKASHKLFNQWQVPLCSCIFFLSNNDGKVNSIFSSRYKISPEKYSLRWNKKCEVNVWMCESVCQSGLAPLDGVHILHKQSSHGNVKRCWKTSLARGGVGGVFFWSGHDVINNTATFPAGSAFNPRKKSCTVFVNQMESHTEVIFYFF